MTKIADREKIERLIDANFNRLKEGIRVVEDINRYIYDDASLTSELKSLRHSLQPLYSKDRLYYRDIENDVQKTTCESELNRQDITTLMIANFSRAQESARVLEECFKLTDSKLSEIAKQARYTLYGIEKRFFIQYTSKES